MGIVKDMHSFQQARISVMQWTTKKTQKALFNEQTCIDV